MNFTGADQQEFPPWYVGIYAIKGDRLNIMQRRTEGRAAERVQSGIGTA